MHGSLWDVWGVPEEAASAGAVSGVGRSGVCERRVRYHRRGMDGGVVATSLGAGELL